MALIEPLLAESQRLSGRGERSRALGLALEAVRQAPHRLDAWLQVATLQNALGQHERAVASFDVMLTRVPQRVPLRARLLALRAQALLLDARWSAAAEAADAATQIRDRDSTTEHLLGIVYSRIGRIDEARRRIAAAVSASPTEAAFHYSLGTVHRFEGRTADAQAALERAIELAPLAGQAHMTLAHTGTWRDDENHCERLCALLARPELPPADLVSVHFAAHKEFHDLGRHEAAWHHLTAANALAERACPWHDAQDAERFAAIRREYPRERLRAAVGSNAGSIAAPDQPWGALPRTGSAAVPGAGAVRLRPRLIFIVGLPRSGSTLIERILSAHSEVHSMGELPMLGALRARLAGASTAELARAYRHEIRALHGDAPIAIDKLPGNHWHVGLIAEAFPDASIIVTHRLPMATLFGAYRLHLGSEYSWCYSQAALARHYVRFAELMAYWSEGLGTRLLHVHHERLVRSPEAEIGRLLAACGLLPEQACFEPHKNPAAVTTATTLQVRNPINTGGFGAWTHYKQQLTPLSRELSARGVVVE